jgi:hypothetical protein
VVFLTNVLAIVMAGMLVFGAVRRGDEPISGRGAGRAA